MRHLWRLLALFSLLAGGCSDAPPPGHGDAGPGGDRAVMEAAAADVSPLDARPRDAGHPDATAADMRPPDLKTDGPRLWDLRVKDGRWAEAGPPVDAAAPVQGAWVKQFHASLGCLASDAQGNGFVVDNWNPYSPQVLKISRTQMPQWTTAAAGACSDAVADSAGNFIITAEPVAAAGGTLAQKFTSLGKAAWTVAVTGAFLGSGVAVDSAGDAFVVGKYSGTVTVGAKSYTAAGLYDVLVAKIGASGTVQWVQSAGSSADDLAVDVAVTTKGELVVGLQMGGAWTLGSKTYTTYGPVVARLSPSDGSAVWVSDLRGGTYRALAADSLGVYLAGKNTGLGWKLGSFTLTFIGGMLVGLDLTTGAVTWLTALGETVNAIAVDGGKIYAAGEFRTHKPSFPNQGNTDLYVARLSSAGAFEVAVPGGTVTDDLSQEIAVGTGGEVFVSGWLGRKPACCWTMSCSTQTCTLATLAVFGSKTTSPFGLQVSLSGIAENDRGFLWKTVKADLHAVPGGIQPQTTFPDATIPIPPDGGPG